MNSGCEAVMRAVFSVGIGAGFCAGIGDCAGFGFGVGAGFGHRNGNGSQKPKQITETAHRNRNGSQKPIQKPAPKQKSLFRAVTPNTTSGPIVSNRARFREFAAYAAFTNYFAMWTNRSTSLFE